MRFSKYTTPRKAESMPENMTDERDIILKCRLISKPDSGAHDLIHEIPLEGLDVLSELASSFDCGNIGNICELKFCLNFSVNGKSFQTDIDVGAVAM